MDGSDCSFYGYFQTYFPWKIPTEYANFTNDPRVQMGAMRINTNDQAFEILSPFGWKKICSNSNNSTINQLATNFCLQYNSSTFVTSSIPLPPGKVTYQGSFNSSSYWYTGSCAVNPDCWEELDCDSVRSLGCGTTQCFWPFIGSSGACQCAPGFTTSSDSNCIDIDECVERTKCPNMQCVNIPGSYFCRPLIPFKSQGT